MTNDARDVWLRVLPIGTENVTRLRETDWSATEIGSMESWPASLCDAVSLVMSSRFPMLIAWGRGLVQIYNDAYIPIFGSKHPAAFGQAVSETWREIFDVVGPMFDRVLDDATATWSENQLLMVNRLGFPEDAYFTFSCSPIRDERGDPAGVLATGMETTAQVVDVRRLRALERLAAVRTHMRSVPAAAAEVADVIAQHPDCLPFGLLYLVEDGAATLVASGGLNAQSTLAAEHLDIRDPEAVWPLSGRVAVTVDDLTSRFPATDVPDGIHGHRARAARVLPLPGLSGMSERPVLVCGISPTRPIDEEHLAFFDLVAGHVASALRSGAEQEIERRRAEQHEDLDRAKTEFFTSVSHEFRIPITLLLGPLSDALADTSRELAPIDRERIVMAQHNAQRLRRLVNDLLEFGRVESDRLDATFAPVDLGALTGDLASMFRAGCERAGLEMIIDAPSMLEPVYVDARLWEHLVLNLVSNALKYTFHGAITITLREVEGGVALDVRDTGTGIPAGDVPRVFKRFYRVRDAQARTHEGAGIGLAFVRRIAELHGGAAELSSTLGVGTTVTVTVPYGSGHLPAEFIAATYSRGGHSRAATLAEETLRWVPDNDRPGFEVAGDERPLVLVADDNADMRTHVANVLREDYRTVLAHDVASALELARQLHPDIVLSDVMMPGIDGFALVTELRFDAELSAVPIILLSARAGHEAIIEGLDAGADDYLVTPFERGELLARMRSNLELARARMRLEQLVPPVDA